MQTFYLGNFQKTQKQEDGARNALRHAALAVTDAAGKRHSVRLGAAEQKESPQNVSMGIDTFAITGQLSELLSPACGMTEEEKAEWLQEIRAKLKSGKRLTAEEMQFLKEQDPALYQQAARVQIMRDSFEARLKHCSSKEDVTNAYCDAVGIVSDDDPMKECIIAAYDDAVREFRETGAYKSLPDTEKEALAKRGKKSKE